MTNSQKLINMDIGTLIEQTRAKDANPGGGAILILVSNLAINLMLMMDKKDWGELKDQANVSYETIISLSDRLNNLMQADVDNFAALMDKIKNESETTDDYIKAAKPILEMVDINIKALQILGFYLEHGKKSTLTDGEIANELLKTANHAAVPTINLNMEGAGLDTSYDDILTRTNSLCQANKKIIERRS